MGGVVLRLLPTKSGDSGSSAGTRTATRFLLGQGLLANLWVILALMHVFSPLLVKGIIAGLLIVGVMSNYRLLVGTAKQLWGIGQEWLREKEDVKLFILAGLFIWLAWLASIGRPSTFDGTRFYLALPKVISTSEQLKPLPGFEDATSFGLQGEMHFAALMTMGSPESIQVFSWLTLTAGIICLLALGRRAGLHRRGQWLALAMILTSSAIIELSGSGKTDMYGAAFAFAAYYWAFRIEGKDRMRASILTGLFGGLAIVAKISYAASFLPSLAVILVWRIFTQDAEKTLPTRILTFVLIGISAILVVAPQPIKNQILFGNPLAPIGMNDVFEQNWYGPDTIQRIRLSLPFALTFGDYWAQIGGITPLVLMFVPLLFFLPKPRHLLKNPLVTLSIASLAGLTCWFIFRPATFAPRYFLGCLLLLILPTSKAAEYFSSQGNTNRRLISTAALLTILAMGLFYSTNVFLPKQTFELLVKQELDCELNPIQCEISNHINKRLKPGERIFTHDAYRYWLRTDLIQCALTTSEMNNYLAIESPKLRWSFIIGRGFRSALLYYNYGLFSKTIQNDLKEIPDWLDVTIVKTHERLIFLQFTPKDDSHPGLYGCGQLSPPAWDVFEITNP